MILRQAQAGGGGSMEGWLSQPRMHLDMFPWSLDNCLQHMGRVNKRACAGLSLAHGWWLTPALFSLCTASWNRHSIKLREYAILTIRGTTLARTSLNRRENSNKDGDSEILTGYLSSNQDIHLELLHWQSGQPLFVWRRSFFSSPKNTVIVEKYHKNESTTSFFLIH